MGKFRLAIFNTQPPHLYYGGVERRIIETTIRLKNHIDITIYSGTKAGFNASTTINGVKIVPCYSTDRIFPVDNWYFNRSLTQKAATIGADVYEAHAVSGYGFHKALKKMGINKPFIHTIHGVLADEYEQAWKNGYQSFRSRLANRFMHRLANLEAQTAKDATLIVTISRYSLEKIQHHYGIKTSKVRIVPNGVNVEKFKPLPNVKAAKEKFGLGSEPCVLFVGSLIPRKGLPFLVEAAKKIVKEQTGTKFLIVGDGPLKNQLISSLEVANLSNNFKFLLNVSEDQLPALYNCADVFVLPSIQEGQGIVLLEAQASGVPIVAFDIGGVNESVRNGETGLLVKRGNSDELADALLKILSDKSLKEKFGANGRKFIYEHFSWQTTADRMLMIYREAMTL